MKTNRQENEAVVVFLNDQRGQRAKAKWVRQRLSSLVKEFPEKVIDYVEQTLGGTECLDHQPELRKLYFTAVEFVQLNADSQSYEDILSSDD